VFIKELLQDVRLRRKEKERKDAGNTRDHKKSLIF